MDYRDFAIELTEDMGFSAEDMLVACLKYMTQDDVKDMLAANEYPMSCEEDKEVEEDLLARYPMSCDKEVEEDLLARYPNAIEQLEVLKRDYLGGTV